MSDTLDPSKLRVAELRAELQARGLDTKGNKTLLTERLREALEKANSDQPEDAGDSELESDQDEQEEEEDPGAVHELEPEFKREAEHDNNPAVDLEPEGDHELEPDLHSEQKPTSLPRKDELSHKGVSSYSLPHKDVKSLEEDDFDFSHRQHARDNTAIKEEVTDQYDKMGYEDAPMQDMSEVKEELGNGYDGSLKSEEIDIKEESIEPMQESPNKEDRRGEKRRAHFWLPSPDSKSKKRRANVEEEVIMEDEPEYDRSAVLLDWHNSDLSLLINKEDFLSAQPLTTKGFGYVWHGVRATYGFTRGRIFYEVKVLDCLPVPHLEEDEEHPHVVRVGWSIDEAGLTLGEDPFSYGYGGTGKASTNLKFKDYGKTFGKGDIIGCYLDLEAEPIVMLFTVNGENQGMAYEIPRSTLGGRALFPHIVTKNCSFKVNFGAEEPWFTPLTRYTYVGRISLQDRVLGGQGPTTRKEAKAVMAIACDERLSQSPVSTIIKDEKRIMDAVEASASIHSTIITKKRAGPLEEMEHRLVMWMEDQVQKCMPLSLLTIQTKARLLFEELKKHYDDTHSKGFVASRGWFHRFKTRHNFHSLNISGEASSADAKGAAKFKDALLRFIASEGYLPDQIFNVDETGLYWKRMPERSYIHKEAKTMPGFKTYKDELTLLLGGNVAGYKLKPFTIYHSANPRALAGISKHMLPVYYRYNKKARMTAHLFEDWFVHCFVPEVKEYCRENNIPFKILLILDDAPSHPQHIGDINENVKVVFLPPNTASLIQPMDQGAVATFKAYYLWNTFAQAVEAMDNKDKDLRTFWKEFNVLNAILNIGRAWKEVTKECMNGIWKNLLKMYVNSVKGFDKDGAVVEINKKIVSLGKSLGLKLEEEDIQELLDVQDVELTAEDLIELAEERKGAEEEEESEEEPEQKFTPKKMAEAFAAIEYGMKLFSKLDVDLEHFAKVERGVQDVLACYRVIYEEQKKCTVQATMDYFLKETAPVPSPSTTFEPQPSHELKVEEIKVEEEQIDEPAALLSPSCSSNI